MGWTYLSVPEIQRLRRLISTLRPGQNGRHFADDIFLCIFLNENIWISIKISLKFVPRGPVNKIPSLVQIMAWRRPGAKPLSEPMMIRLLTLICVTRPQWVNQGLFYIGFSFAFLKILCWLRFSCNESDYIQFSHILIVLPTYMQSVLLWYHVLYLTPPSAAYMRQWMWSAWVQKMTCCLF